MRPGAEECDDVALLRGVRRGDEEALAALYDRHAGWLTLRMTRRCAMPDVVDHAVQDTFLALWRKHIGFFEDYTQGVAAQDDASPDRRTPCSSAAATERRRTWPRCS